MNRHLRLGTLALILLLICSGGAAAFDWDWGGSIDNTTQLGFSQMYDETQWTQNLKLGLWVSALQSLNSGGSITMTAAGSYRFTDERDYIFDVDLLRAVGRYPGALGPRTTVVATLGRTPFRDPTGLVLDHLADGGIVTLSFPRASLRAGAAYTGLLLSPSSTIRMSNIDYTEQSTDDEFFGPKRAIGLLDFRFRNTTLFTLAQVDLRDADATGEDLVNTQYFGITGTARFGRSTYWDNLLIVNTGQTETGANEDNLFGFVVGTGLRYFNEDLRFSRASFRALFTSPYLPVEEFIGFDIDTFTPMNEPSLGLVFSPRMSNLIFAELDYSLRPFAGSVRGPADSVRIGAAGRAYFRGRFAGFTNDPDFVGQIDPDSDSMYLGTEVELGVAARVLSDLGLGLRTGVFLPGSGDLGAFSSDRKPEWVVRFDLSTAF
ncbi:MAG: hypothetical protein EA403_13935 [Spirochaetaceae bacterium]|nr:MAG: hypothetical protein EA403_13935 [Spirochaetaceae bacterium]